MSKPGALGVLVHTEVLKGSFFISIQQPPGLVVGGGCVAVPLAAEQHFQPGGIAVLPGRLCIQARCAAGNARDGVRLVLHRSRSRGVLFGIFQQQRTDVLAVGALAVFIVRAVAGRADKAAVLPQPCLRVVIAAALALHHGRKVAHAVLVDGAGALLDALAVLFGPLKNILAQKRADLVCIHGCSLPVWL